MPTTPWDDVAGVTCQCCGLNPATHIYGDLYICCDCHTGEKDGGLFTAEEAAAAHAEVLATRGKGTDQ